MKLITFTKQSLAIWLIFGLATSSLLAQTDSRRGSGVSPRQTQASSINNLLPIPQQPIHFLENGKVTNHDKASGDTLFFQNFTATTWPATMPRVNADGLTPNNPVMGNNAWVAGTITSATIGAPGRYAISTSWYIPNAGTSDDWMITPPITVTDNNKIRWISKAGEVDFEDGYEVRVCTSCPATFTAANVLSSFSNTIFSLDADQAGPFASHEVSLGTYAGQTIQIAFRNNSNDKNLLYIDDILVYKQPAIDISASAILSPSNFVYDCSRADFPSSAAITNLGANTAYNVIVKLNSDGPLSDSVTFILDSIPGTTRDTIVFAEGLNMSVLGQYTLTLSTLTSGDNNGLNDMFVNSYTHRGPELAPYTTNFDGLSTDSVLPQEWFVVSAILPFSETGGFSGSQSLLLPVFNNHPTLGTQSTCKLSTSKFKSIPAGSYLMFKYKLTTTGAAEYGMKRGDTIYVRGYQNCQPLPTLYTIDSSNHESSTNYKKIFIPLDAFNLTSTDEVTFEFFLTSAPETALYIFSLDDFTIGAAPSNDVALTDIARIPYSQIKKYQLGLLKFKGSVFNEGLTDLSPIRIEATVSPLGIVDTARINSLPSGSFRPFTTTPGFMVATSGLLNISINATNPGTTDPNPNNNIETINIEATDSTMATDYGDPLDNAFLQYGTGSGGKRIIANAIATVLKDTLTSVSVYVGPLDEDCEAKAFFASKNGANWVEDSSVTIVPITQDLAESWVTLKFRKTTPATAQRGKPVVANTTNLYGVKIRGGNLRVGFNFENAKDDGSFIWLGSWLGTQDINLGALLGPFSVFIRPNFGRTSTIISSLTQLEQSLQFADIVPNPANGGTNLVFSTAKESPVTINLLSMTGQLISQKEHFAFKGTNRLEIPVKGLSKGIYLVKVNSEGFSATKKLIID